MGTVQVVDATKTLEIEANSVTGGFVNGSNHLILTTGGGDEIDAGTVGGGSTVVDASDTVKGIVELATDVETQTGTDTARAVTPFGLASLISSATRRGLVELATNAEASTGTDTARAITPANLASVLSAGYQPLDSDLTAIGGLSPANDDIIQRKAGAWVNRTMAQLSTDLGLGSSLFYNVKSTGSVKGDGTTDDTTALNAMIAASPAGGTVYFPPGTYIISAPIVLYPDRKYVGGGHAFTAGGATIKLKNGTNLTNGAGLTGLLVSQGWSTNATLSGNPISIENLAIDGNSANNATSTACGIVMVNFWSVIRGCYIYDIPKHGIHLTDVGANGTTAITNSASENRIVDCKITDCLGNGFNQSNTVAGANLDGFLTDCYISDITGEGIHFDRSPGWSVRRCHLYGIGKHGIEMGFTFATIVDNCYIEDFGNQNAASTWYWGIGFTGLNDRGTIITNNTISCAEPNTVTTSNYYYIRANAGSSQTTVRAVVTGNLMYGANRSLGVGIALENNSGGTMTAVVQDNQISNIVTPYTATAAITFDTGQVAATGQPTAAAGAQAASASINSGSTNVAGWFTMTGKSSGMAAGVLGTITFSKAFPISPKSVVISPTNGAASAAQIYATWSTTAITISTNAALAASAVLTFAYIVAP